MCALGTTTIPAQSADGMDDSISTLRIGFLQSVDSLNPYIGLADAAYVLYSLVYDNPHSVDNNLNPRGNLFVDTAPVPASDPDLLATGEPYGSVWEYRITTNAEWHDGTPFTVDDVVFNINLNSENYETLWAFQPYTHSMHYAEAIDDQAVRIHFYDRETMEPRPAAYAGMIGIPMLPRHMLDSMSPEYIVESWEGVHEGASPPMIGTGPFMATETIYDDWSSGREITLVRNPTYHYEEDWGEIVHFEQIQMRFYSSPSQMSIDLVSGVIDVAQLPPDEYSDLKEQVESGSIMNIETYDGLKCTQYFTEIGFNMGDGGLNKARLDPAVRRAMAMATDKQYIVDHFYHGLAEAGSTIISPVNSQWHYELDTDEIISYDLEAAGQVLEDAGYKYHNPVSVVREATDTSLAVLQGWVDKGTELSFQMLVREESPEEKEIASFLRTQWAQIGIELSYVVVPEETLSEIVYDYDYDLMLWYWSADVDPNYMLFSQSRMAWDGWSDNMYYNESYEENFTLSTEAMDLIERQTYVDNCQRIHYLDAAYIVLAYPYQTYAWHTDTFEGWGDWESQPGRSLDNFWSANPLLFDLEPAGNESPVLLYVGAGTVGAAVALVGFMVLRKRHPKKNA